MPFYSGVQIYGNPFEIHLIWVVKEFVKFSTRWIWIPGTAIYRILQPGIRFYTQGKLCLTAFLYICGL